MAAKLRKGGPCQGTACGWKFEGFHICLNQSQVLMTRIEDGRYYSSQDSMREGKRPAAKRGPGRNNPEARARISNSLRERSASDPQKQERNKEIVRLYSEEELTMREVAERMEIQSQTVMNVLHQAANRGEVIIRKAARRTGKY